MAQQDRHGNTCHKRIQIHIYSLRSPRWDYSWAIEYAEQLYGSNGIYFDIRTAVCPVISEADDVALNVVDGTCRWDQSNTEQDRLHTAVGLGSYQGIAVFIVGGINNNGSTISGCAGHKPSKPTAVVSATGTNYTLAHEVGHVLLGSDYSPVHTSSTSNIMIGGTWQIPNGTRPTFNNNQVAELKRSTLLDSI